MLFREHRGGYAESMTTVVVLGGRADLAEHIRKVYPVGFGFDWDDYDIDVRQGSVFRDKRNGWDTYLVTVRGKPVGYTDGPLRP